MGSFPGPVHGDDSAGAERRLKALHSRFSRVSASLGQARRRRNAGEWAFSPFEAVILAGLVLFIAWAVGAIFF